MPEGYTTARKEIRITKHAVEKMLALDLTDDIKKTIELGKEVREGRSKMRYIFKGKRGTLVVICHEYPDHIAVKTVVKGG